MPSKAAKWPRTAQVDIRQDLHSIAVSLWLISCFFRTSRGDRGASFTTEDMYCCMQLAAFPTVVCCPISYPMVATGFTYQIFEQKCQETITILERFALGWFGFEGQSHDCPSNLDDSFLGLGFRWILIEIDQPLKRPVSCISDGSDSSSN